jgi:hypothetical protein
MTLSDWIRWNLDGAMLPVEEERARCAKARENAPGSQQETAQGPLGSGKRLRWCMVCQMRKARGQVVPEECEGCKWH